LKVRFKSIAVLKNYVKDINQNYADIAIMVKELALSELRVIKVAPVSGIASGVPLP